MSVFSAYSRYYDLLYRDKDYQAEANYVANIIERHAGGRSVLELGCGTGSHAAHLAEMGYRVHGVDLSETMLAKAQERRTAVASEISARMTFELGDARSTRVGKKFDSVISLFHVMSYQTTNAEIEASFSTAAVHLEAGGIFLFDVWYGPAVLTERPEVRVKRLEDDAISVTRIAEPAIHANENVVDVKYQVWIEVKASGALEKVRETHRMRYFFKPELELMLAKSGFQLLTAEEWLTGRELDFTTWSATFAARKR